MGGQAGWRREVKNLDVTQIWSIVAWVATAIVLLANAAEKIVRAVKAAKSPNDKQNERLDRLEKWRQDVDRRLTDGNTHFDTIDEGNRVTQKALLALLAHSIDGNNIKDLEEAKHDLENHLINR